MMTAPDDDDVVMVMRLSGDYALNYLGGAAIAEWFKALTTKQSTHVRFPDSFLSLERRDDDGFSLVLR